MNKKLLIIYILLFSFVLRLNGQANEKQVLIIPFDNRDNQKYDYLKEHITNSFINNLSDTSGFKAIPLARLYALLKTKGYKPEDLFNEDILVMVAVELTVDYIIRGDYSERHSYFEIDFEVFDVIQRKIIYKREDYGKGGISVFETMDTLIAVMVNDFIEITSSYIPLAIDADHLCSVYIDEQYVGETPLHVHLATGKHGIKALYNDGTGQYKVFDKPVYVNESGNNHLYVRVFVTVTFEAETTCSVYLDDQLIGSTPYRGVLYSGNGYQLKLTTPDRHGNNVVVAAQSLYTGDGDDITIRFPVNGAINILDGNKPVKCRIDGGAAYDIPHLFDHLLPGYYSVEIILDDPQKKREFLFYDKRLYLNPADEKIIDISLKEYKRHWLLCFIPSAAQFHNQETVKGMVVLSSILFLLIGSGVTYYTGQYFYNEYTALYNAGKYDEAEKMFETVTLYKYLTFSTLGLAGCMYMYSLIDGFIGMDYLHTFLNSGKP